MSGLLLMTVSSMLDRLLSDSDRNSLGCSEDDTGGVRAPNSPATQQNETEIQEQEQIKPVFLSFRPILYWWVTLM